MANASRKMASCFIRQRLGKSLVPVWLLMRFVMAMGASGCGEKTHDRGATRVTDPGEVKAIEFLRGKGARIDLIDPKKRLLQPGEPYWHVSLPNYRISDTDLHQLQHIKSLKSVAIQNNAITDDGIAALVRIGTIEDLFLANLSKVTDRGIDVLADISSLKALTVSGMEITGVGFKRFSRLKKLKALTVGGLPITDEGLRCLATLSWLVELDLHGAGITDQGLTSLRPLTELKTLRLGKTKVSNLGMDELAAVPSLRFLDLDGTEVGNDGLRRLSRSKSLRALELTETKIDDEGLAHIAAFSNLEHLGLMNTKITDRGLQHLQKVGLKSLNITFSDNKNITDKGLLYLYDMKTLDQLRFAIRGTGATSEGYRRLREALPHAFVGVPTK